MRPPRILHCTSEPFVFVGREAELALLDRALHGEETSLVAFVGPGGQGKTAIVQHWLSRSRFNVDALFFWSFYRGKDVDLCLREWLAYAEGLAAPPEVSADWCVDRLVKVMRRERWAVVLDGAEVVQYEEAPWQGRFVHPDLARLLEELASEAMPGLVVLTTRFSLPTLAHRQYVKLVTLDRLDRTSARALLTKLGVEGDLDRVAHLAGRHAKAVELAGTYLVHYHAGHADELHLDEGDDEEEASVRRVLSLFQQALSAEQQDILVLATAFREPATEALLLDYLRSDAVRELLHITWGRHYTPFADREYRPSFSRSSEMSAPAGALISEERLNGLQQELDRLVTLRLLERVGPGTVPVIDAHPLVRRAFEHVAGPAGGRESALARAGFLRGRPDRRRPETLEEARETIELFHAYCAAGLWIEADSAFRALDNPKHRFLAPALERDLLLSFFPHRDYRQPPLWAGFGRWRSLAIALEMLGDFEGALEVYRPTDAALRGDALLALGRLTPLLETRQMPAPWQTLWQAYRCHALALAGRMEEGVALARTLVPVDVYEWTHVFECLLRAGRLDLIDPRHFASPQSGEHHWAELARRRMRVDYQRVRYGATEAVGEEYQALNEKYDRTGLPVERTLTRLGYARWLMKTTSPRLADVESLLANTIHLTTKWNLVPFTLDAQEMLADIQARRGEFPKENRCLLEKIRENAGIYGVGRP